MSMSTTEILYRADGYVVINKPVGAESEDKGEGSAPALVKNALGIDEAYPIHRLDKIARGAFLCATNKKSAARLSAEMTEGKFEKEYLAICEGEMDPPSGECDDLLFYDRQRKKSYIVSRARGGVKRAQLRYECVMTRTADDGRVLTLVRIWLMTGRTHQIRAQLSYRGHPLLGDGKYGSKYNRTSAALMCRALTVSGKRIECPMPTEHPWDLFSEVEPHGSEEG